MLYVIRNSDDFYIYKAGARQIGKKYAISALAKEIQKVS